MSGLHELVIRSASVIEPCRWRHEAIKATQNWNMAATLFRAAACSSTAFNAALAANKDLIATTSLFAINPRARLI